MSEHWPFIAVEIVMVFGGALAFAWWQFRDLDREKKKREARQERERREAADAADTRATPPHQPSEANGHAS